MRPAALLLLLLLSATVVRAETILPGDYADVGRVVRTARGGFELFDGFSCSIQLNERLQEELRPHVGRYVRVDYTRVEWQPDMIADAVGAPIGKIRAITRLDDGKQAPEFRFEIRALERSVDLATPVCLEVTATNVTEESHSVDLTQGEARLLQYHHSVLAFSSDDPAARTKSRSAQHVAPGESVSTVLTCSRMARPGRYEVVFTLPRGDRPYDLQSELTEVTVRESVSDAERLAALRAWLPRAALGQRAHIAEQMAALGDVSGTEEILRLYRDPRLRGVVRQDRLRRYLWAHGGEEAERLLLLELASATTQDAVLRVIEDVSRSPRRAVILDRLLSDDREVSRSSNGWGDLPQVGDLTAYWLTGYTDGRLTFPREGDRAARDAAIAVVAQTLANDPSAFSNLAD